MIRVLSPDVSIQLGGRREVVEREKQNERNPLWKHLQLMAAAGLTIAGIGALMGAMPIVAPLAGNLIMAGGGIGFSAMRERGA